MREHGWRWVLALALTVPLASIAGARAADLPAEEIADREPPEPRCLGPELDRLSFLEGKWTVESRQRVDFATERFAESKGRSVWRRRVGGCVLEEEWTGTMDGEHLEWLRLVGYNRREERWEVVTVDSAHGNFLETHGRFEGDRLVLHAPQMRKGKLLIDRATVERSGPDQFRWVVESSLDGGRTWLLFWTLTYSRR